jgi:hypothetical protein
MPEPIGTQVFDVGASMRSRCYFRVDGTLTDPTTVTFKFKNPAGTVTTWVYGVGAEVKKSATGSYWAVVPLDSAGSWYHRWEGTGTAKGAKERLVQVQPSKFT